jgi:predicted transcriptional regulator
MAIILAQNSSKRRDKLVIMAEIVSIAKKGASKTRIMLSANLSFSQLNQYLELLSEANLLEPSSVGGKRVYKSTQRGLEFMEKQCDILSYLNGNVGVKSLKTSFDFRSSARDILVLNGSF